MPLWREQWDRVVRMLGRVQAIYDGRPEGGTADAKDDVYSFFQNVHHLRDWLGHDPASGLKRSDLTAVINASKELRICGDLCNGSKHSKLTNTWTGDLATSMPRGDVAIAGPTIHAAVAFGGGPAPPTPPATGGKASHRFYLQSGGLEYDALDLANEAVAQWRSFLTQRGLL